MPDPEDHQVSGSSRHDHWLNVGAGKNQRILRTEELLTNFKRKHPSADLVALSAQGLKMTDNAIIEK
jgi:hypothetical protein